MQQFLLKKKNSSADMIMSTGDWLIITQEVEILTVDHNVSVHVVVCRNLSKHKYYTNSSNLRRVKAIGIILRP